MAEDAVKDVSAEALMERFQKIEERLYRLEAAAGIGRPEKLSPEAK